MIIRMICLVGEQPIPNLLPIRQVKPAEVLLVYTDATKRVHGNLLEMLSDLETSSLRLAKPHDLPACLDEIGRYVQGRGWPSSECLFNVTGGTKPMAIAATLVATRIDARIAYLLSSGNQTVLTHWRVSSDGAASEQREILPDLITINDYFAVHGLDLKSRSQDPTSLHADYEQRVHDALLPCGYEIMRGVCTAGCIEIDLVLRLGNKVAIVEIKHGKNNLKHGIDQLNTASRSEHLGSHTARFLAVAHPLLEVHARLAEAHKITTVVVSEKDGSLAVDEVACLRQRIAKALA